ncbi:MAG TPA: amino acid deaminase/aldolase [Solirubrobacteraceae bacterium]|jgi:D-serine deaminase-like pyridoxal phosphate-dependent protein|nr:amino acid deaminase/aldolase [Solirubrobacteraceae bacterium]
MNTPLKDADLGCLERATASLDPPFAVVDLDAFWANAADMEARAAPKPIRLASKSVRCRALQERVLARPGFAGTLAFTLPEALWLAGHGFSDIVVAYPTADRRALRELALLTAERPDTRVAIMVDSLAQLDLLDAAIGAREGTTAGSGSSVGEGHGNIPSADRAPVRVCIELDAGLWALGGRVRIGAKRSPLHTPAQAAALARAVVARDGVRLVGLMAYEAQIAGLGDAPSGRGIVGGWRSNLRGHAIRLLQARSARELATRRALAVEAVRAIAPLEFVNGGGTGSLHGTAREVAVTEIAAGSGLYGPTLFDAYRAFAPRPAALFALPIVRRPAPTVVTALGGGYLASGPADAARLPRPHLPPGLRLDRQEGAGEVQTPLLGPPARALAIGDRVWMRHAKAGELCERFDRLYLIEGERIVEEVPTYRGEGQCFL